MSNRLHIPCLALILAFAAPLIAEEAEAPKPRGEKITLAMRLKKGDVKAIHFKMDMTSTASAQGQVFEMVIKMGMHLGTKVEDVDAKGLHTLKVSYDRITMDMTSPVFALAYDSKDKDKAPAENPAFAVYNAMIGEALTLKVQSDGTTKEVLGLDELAKKIEAVVPPGANVKNQLESLKTSFDQFAVYPDKPVDIGDSWTRTLKMSPDPNMPMVIDATYTLYDRKEGKAILKMHGKINAANGMLKGTNIGTLEVDEATGWISGGNMVMDMKGEIQGASVVVKGKTVISDK